MAKLKFDDSELKQLVRDLKRTSRDVDRTFIGDNAVLKRIAERIHKNVLQRWQVGKAPMTTGAQKVRIEKIDKDTTVPHRERMLAKGDLDGRTKPTKSNLIATGKTIDEFKELGVISVANGEAIIGVESERATNILHGNEKEYKRPMLIMDDKEVEIIEKEVDKQLDQIIARFLK